MFYNPAPCKRTRIPESGKVLQVESGMKLRESGTPPTIGIQNTSSTLHAQGQESTL